MKLEKIISKKLEKNEKLIVKDDTDISFEKMMISVKALGVKDALNWVLELIKTEGVKYE